MNTEQKNTLILLARETAKVNELEAQVEELTKLVASLEEVRAKEYAFKQAKVEELTANNANLVEKNAFLRQRPDLPVDRIPAYTAMQAKVEQLETETFHCKFPETCMENRKTREDLTKANTDLMFEIAKLKAERMSDE